MVDYNLVHDIKRIPSLLKKIESGVVTSKELERAFFRRDSHDGVYMSLLCRENLPEVLIDLLLKTQHPEKLFFLSQCPNLTEAHFRKLMNFTLIEYRLEALRNPKFPVALIVDMLQKPNLSKRERGICLLLLQKNHPEYAEWPLEWISESVKR